MQVVAGLPLNAQATGQASAAHSMPNSEKSYGTDEGEGDEDGDGDVDGIHEVLGTGNTSIKGLCSVTTSLRTPHSADLTHLVNSAEDFVERIIGTGISSQSGKSGSDTKANTNEKIRTLATVKGPLRVNQGAMINPSNAFDFHYVSIGMDQFEMLKLLPHSAGIKNRSFPGHKEVTGYYLGCTRAPGGSVDFIKVLTHALTLFNIILLSYHSNIYCTHSDDTYAD